MLFNYNGKMEKEISRKYHKSIGISKSINFNLISLRNQLHQTIITIHSNQQYNNNNN